MKKEEIEYKIASIKFDDFQKSTMPSSILLILGAVVIFAFSRRKMINKMTKNTNNMNDDNNDISVATIVYTCNYPK